MWILNNIFKSKEGAKQKVRKNFNDLANEWLEYKKKVLKNQHITIIYYVLKNT